VEKIALLQFNNIKDDLLFWIKQYIASKIYVLSVVDGQKEFFSIKKSKYYLNIINATNIDELEMYVKVIIHGGLSGLRTYSLPISSFYRFVAEDKNIHSIKDINTQYFNNYAMVNLSHFKDSTKRTYYNQLYSLFKFINKNSFDEDNFKFQLKRVYNKKSSMSLIKNHIEKKFRYLEPHLFMQFIQSIKTYKSKRVDVYNQKLLIKFLCFATLKSNEIRFILKNDCSIKTIQNDKYLQISISNQVNERNVFIRYSYIQDDYEKTVELNKDCDYLFYTRDNKPYEEQTIYTLVNRFYKNAGIESKNLGINALRYSWPVYLWSKGISVDTIIGLLGKIDIEIQDLYLNHTVASVKKMPIFFKSI